MTDLAITPEERDDVDARLRAFVAALDLDVDVETEELEGGTHSELALALKSAASLCAQASNRSTTPSGRIALLNLCGCCYHPAFRQSLSVRDDARRGSRLRADCDETSGNPSRMRRGWLMIRRSILVTMLISVASGCSLGRFALSVNREKAVPFPEVTVLPDQWEP